MRNRVSSFRKKALSTMSIIVIPLFIVITLFVVFTIRNQHTAVRSERISKLSAYQSQFDSTVQTANAFLRNTVASNNDFLSIVYAKSRTEAYVASEAVAKTLNPLLKADPILGGFYTYSKKFDYYRPNNTESYPLPDATLIREAIYSISAGQDILHDWTPITLSDRTVLLSAAVFRNTVVAAILDPYKQTFSGLDSDEYIFCISETGDTYETDLPFSHIPLKADTNVLTVTDADGHRFESVLVPLNSISGYMAYAAPLHSSIAHLSITQIILLLVALFLFASIPAYWLTFQRVLLEPMNNLSATMQEIQAGNTLIHVPQHSNIQEVNEIAGTVNIMLDTLRQQRIDFYEQQLKTQQAQLQYLQLQIRPHFYLSCLNMIFSMAEEKDFNGIQSLVLDLSAYLRGMFRDNTKLVSLRRELSLVESYVRIQQNGAANIPALHMDISPDVYDILIPPLSILTFVENAFKHNKHTDVSLKLQVKCKRIHSEDGSWFNISIMDNCGGASESVLTELNRPAEFIAREHHVGILNVKQRFSLLYGDDATLSFRNNKEGLSVDIYLPIG